MSEQIYFKPGEMLEQAREVATIKANTPRPRLFILAILAGIYIGFGGLLVTLVATGGSQVSYGLLRLLMGLVFCIGLILVVVGGAELFTGSTVISLAKIDGKISWSKLISSWTLVYFGNFLGAVLLAFLILWSGQYHSAHGLVGESMFNIANSKLQHSFSEAFFLGILCNIFVCLGIWLAYSSKSTGDKILAIIFPITAFVALGFEHSVANMYLLISPWLIQIFDQSFLASHSSLVGLSLSNILINNLLPVSLGNIVGGVFVWLAYRFAYKK